ncbi:MAG: hypothetical protein HY236_08590 [Acidobacteria bacterium]|nr:hypothetical protein [Acidobacteriota bacterium]
MFDELRTFTRYAGGLRAYLQQTLSPEECRRRIENQLRARQETFLQILERGIFTNPRSPYRNLLTRAGVEFSDIAQMVRATGIETTLEKLYDRGVYVTLDEFKGRKPIERAGLHLPVGANDFDNPLLARHYEAATGGSSGVRRRILIDFDLLTHEAAYYHFFLQAFNLEGRPLAEWREILPGAAGMKLVLRYARLGRPVEKWFTPRRLAERPENWKSDVFTVYSLCGSRLWGRTPLPVPEHVPPAEAWRIARWLAEKKKGGTPAVMDTPASSGVLICRAAKELGLDISGTFFRFGGEPYTPAKARIIAEMGCRAAGHYSMTEIGVIGLACGDPGSLDDVHLMTDKVAAIQRQKQVGSSGICVGALIYSTLLPSCPKIMLNIESDDYGVLEDRQCGCVLGGLGFSRHIHDIRSYEKLTSAGMSFLGTELISLVEEILPGRFGGHPTDYQFVEEEQDGLTKVRLVVSPRVGAVNEKEVLAEVLRVLRSYPGGRMMADVWRDGRVLEIARREPYATGAFKILPLHILKKAGPRQAAGKAADS